MSELAATERPDRPLLTPPFWSLLSFLSCARLTLGAGPLPGAAVAVAAGVLATGLAVGFALSRTRLRAAVSVAAALALGAACACLVCAGELARQGALAEALSSSPVSAWELEVESDMSEGASGWRGRAAVLRDGRRVGRVWLLAEGPYGLGDILRCVGRFGENEEDEWGASSRAQGLSGTVRAVRVLSSRPADGLRGAVLALRGAVLGSLDAASSDPRALVAGAICASTQAMSERGLDELFSACGVSHLVAVSGGHLVLVSAVVSALLGRTRLWTLPRTLTLLCATALFVAFCGAPVSAVRSWVMVLAAELSRLAGRRAHPLSSASVTALAMAALDPGVTGQLGFVLSVACVCGICALGGYARYVLRVLAWRRFSSRGRASARAFRSVFSSAQEALALTVVSQAVTMPFTCATFGTLSLVAPLANVLLVPLFSLVLVLGLAAALLVWAPPLQALVLVPCDAVGSAVVWLARRLAGLPLACVPVSVEEGPALALLGVLLAALLVAWPRVTRRALVGTMCVALTLGLAWHLRWRLFAPACVRVLDVGQGDAILVTDGSSSLLVDTGPGDAVVGACARNHVTHLDAILVTHLHDDHVGGIEALGGVVSVGEVLVAEGVALEAGDVPVSSVRRGDVVRIGRFSLEVLSPSGPVDGLENEDSVVCSLAYEDEAGRTLSALLTGDAERDVTDVLVESGDVGGVDLLKVGHHGSEVSVSEGAAAALMPEVSVASAGEGNAYGHPDPACVEILEDTGSTFLCTMDVGDVCVEPGVEGPLVSCQRRSVRDATLR